MTTPNWQIQTPFDAILFDCDGTLSTIEGIDELAKYKGAASTVKALTADAMSRTGLNVELYEQRLNLVKPTETQVLELGQTYFDHQVQDSYSVIQLFKRLNKAVYIISAGLRPSVQQFGKLLEVNSENIFAVDIQFDAAGEYLDFDHDSPLTHRNGKRDIVKKLRTLHRQMLYVGDGLNDLPVMDQVQRFVGYGGSFFRKNIADACDFYICTDSLSALLPLALTEGECNQLSVNEAEFYQKGLDLIVTKKVLIK